MKLNAFTYMAMSKKIESMKPRELCSICEDLTYDLYSGKSDEILYSLACTAKAQSRLHSISKIKLPRGIQNKIQNALSRIETYLGCTITDSELLDSIFYQADISFSVDLYNLDHMIALNEFLTKLTKRITGMKLIIRPPSLNELLIRGKEDIVYKALLRVIPEDSPIFNYFSIPSNNTMKYLDEVSIRDMQLFIEVINELKEQHDRSTTN